MPGPLGPWYEPRYGVRPPRIYTITAEVLSKPPQAAIAFTFMVLRHPNSAVSLLKAVCRRRPHVPPTAPDAFYVTSVTERHGGTVQLGNMDSLEGIVQDILYSLASTYFATGRVPDCVFHPAPRPAEKTRGPFDFCRPVRRNRS